MEPLLHPKKNIIQTSRIFGVNFSCVLKSVTKAEHDNIDPLPELDSCVSRSLKSVSLFGRMISG